MLKGMIKKADQNGSDPAKKDKQECVSPRKEKDEVTSTKGFKK